jgi:hypothetical protein
MGNGTAKNSNERPSSVESVSPRSCVLLNRTICPDHGFWWPAQYLPTE